MDNLVEGRLMKEPLRALELCASLTLLEDWGLLKARVEYMDGAGFP